MVRALDTGHFDPLPGNDFDIFVAEQIGTPMPVPSSRRRHLNRTTSGP
ncbi:hypothetical protein [Streptomyces sp. NPDC002187]